VDIATRIPAGLSRIQIPAGSTNFPLLQISNLALRSHTGAKATDGAILNIRHLVENEWSYTSAPLIRLHGLDDNFTLLVLR
jgi:hypothetical protein